MSERPCTCHPDDNPPVPCPRKYALTDCRHAAEIARAERAEQALLKMRSAWDEYIAVEGARLVMVEQQRDRLAAALREYGSHKWDCVTRSRLDVPCNCGLRAALAEVEEKI